MSKEEIYDASHLIFFKNENEDWLTAYGYAFSTDTLVLSRKEDWLDSADSKVIDFCTSKLQECVQGSTELQSGFELSEFKSNGFEVLIDLNKELN